MRILNKIKRFLFKPNKFKEILMLLLVFPSILVGTFIGELLNGTPRMSVTSCVISLIFVSLWVLWAIVYAAMSYNKWND